MKTHKDLDVWKKSIDLVTKVYNITSSYPKEDIFGLTNQIRRASISIPSNIAEGAARTSRKEFKRSLTISLGSTSELETQCIISKNLNYISESQFQELSQNIDSVRRMLIGLIKTIK
jgi:four helix bundle protein